MWRTHRGVVLGCALTVAVLIGAGVGLALLLPSRAGETSRTDAGRASDRSEQAITEEAILVQAVRPRCDPSFVISIQQLASVEAYYQADLRSRVAGPVKFVQKDIGDPVTQGTLLVEIDVPDLVQEVSQKRALVQQARAELVEAENDLHTMEAAVEAARTQVDEKLADLDRTAALRDFCNAQLKRTRALAEREAITMELVEEKLKEFQAAEAARKGGEVSVRRARLDLRVAEARVATTRAGLETRRAHIAVAEEDRKRVEALADLAKVRAPFDGIITRREVDPGAFVQNAATAHTEPLVSVARTDIVTVVMRVPDNAAPFVTLNTEAEIQLDGLPGRVIRGRVTRFSPSIRDKDRTMRVEVDLYNGTEAEYHRFAARAVATFLSPMSTSGPCPTLTLTAASRGVWGQNVKGSEDPFPLLAKADGDYPGGHILLPGLTGYMRLLLHRFPNAYLLPSSSIFNLGGKPYIEEVRDGTAHLMPVRVQMNDGRLAKVAVIVSEANPKLGAQEVFQELTGKEQIIISRQAEIGEGQAVKTALVSW